VVLRLVEITLVDAVTSQQVVVEAERNLADKLPVALPTFRLLVSRCLGVVPDPTASDREPYRGPADGKDLPLLVAAHRDGCSWLVTCNLRHLVPGHQDVTVLRSGDFVVRVRDLLARLRPDETDWVPT
jgi:hypothetical protein